MTAERMDFHGMSGVRLENDFLQVIVALHSGDILDYVNKRTGHHQFWVSEDAMKASRGEYGIRLPWIGRPELLEGPAYDRDTCSLTMRARTGSLTQTFVFALDATSAVLRLTHTLENTSGTVQHPDPRLFYFFNVASQAEKSGILSGSGVRFNGMTVPHGRHRVFVGKACSWPGERLWENHEVDEDVYEPYSFREKTYLRPRWFAVVDSEAREGVAVRFDRQVGFVRSWVPGFAFSYAITVEQDFPVGALGPGESRMLAVDVSAISGISRVDHVGPSCALEIDLIAALRLEERQEIKVRGTAFRPGVAQGKFRLLTHKVDLEEDFVLEMPHVGDTAERAWSGGPYGSKEWLEAIWYYVHKKPGDCSRPTPRVEFHVDGAQVDRWFAPSPENEEILERIERHVEVMAGRVRSGEAPREMASALRVFREQADELRRERIDPDGMYVFLERAEFVANAEIPVSGFRLFDPDGIRPIAGDGTVSPILQDIRRRILEEEDAFYRLGAPGRRAYMPSFELARHAACAAICHVCFEDVACGRRAVRALMAFADDFARYRLTGAGNILHLSCAVPPLVIAHDLVCGLLDGDQEVRLQRYLFWLADLVEGHVNAKGDNDEIHEAGAIAWLAARFPYLPDSRRRLRRAHAVLCRQALVINDDGGWPESPNYNAQITVAYMVHAILMKRAGMPIHTGKTGDALRRLLDWLMRVLTPDCWVPVLGDGVERRQVSEPFFLGASLFEDGRYLTVAQKLLEYQLREGNVFSDRLGPVVLLSYPVGLEPKQVTLSRVVTLPHTGYILLRSGDDPRAEFLISDYGPHKPGHGHRDKLSFEFYAFGENLIRDTGYGIYNTERHNLVVVDGRDQERLCGRLESLKTGAGGIVRAVVSAEVSPGVTHTRQFIYLPSRWLLIHDHLLSDAEHEYAWRVHFNGMVKGEIDHFVYRSSAGPGVLLLPLGEKARIEDAQTTTYSDKAGVGRRPIHRVVMTDRGKEKEFLALLVAFEKTPPEAGLEWEAQGASAIVRTGASVQSVRIRRED